MLMRLSLAVLLSCWSAEAIAQGLLIIPKADVTVSGSATLVLAANTLRHALRCSNTSASGAVRWGDSTVSATRGQRIPAGASIKILFKGDVYMISEGASVTVSCTEETR
jgi:hypothetical protein